MVGIWELLGELVSVLEGLILQNLFPDRQVGLVVNGLGWVVNEVLVRGV